MNTNNKFGIVACIATGIFVGTSAVFGSFCMVNNLSFKLSVIRGETPAWKSICLEEMDKIERRCLAIANGIQVIEDTKTDPDIAESKRLSLTEQISIDNAMIDMSVRRLKALAQAPNE